MIQVKDVVKTFDGFRALDGLTMTVPSGSIYGLVGPNGAGKSTILRHINGVYRQDSGEVLVDGAPVRTRGKKVYIALNKPVGIVCTADPREKANIVDFIGHKERIYPIGRLDKDSEGLILLTSDGDIVNKILRAAGKHEKEYEVEVDKPITGEFLRAMESGVPILDTVTLPCKIRKTGERRFTLILVQGLNRQIRRMCEYLGYRVVRLKRVRIMNVRLGNLKSGHWRNLTARELEELLRAL